MLDLSSYAVAVNSETRSVQLVEEGKEGVVSEIGFEQLVVPPASPVLTSSPRSSKRSPQKNEILPKQPENRIDHDYENIENHIHTPIRELFAATSDPLMPFVSRQSPNVSQRSGPPLLPNSAVPTATAEYSATSALPVSMTPSSPEDEKAMRAVERREQFLIAAYSTPSAKQQRAVSGMNVESDVLKRCQVSFFKSNTLTTIVCNSKHAHAL